MPEAIVALGSKMAIPRNLTTDSTFKLTTRSTAN